MAAVVVAVGACSPVTTVSRYGIDARLIEQATGEPIQRSGVTIRIDDAVFERKTDRQGRIRVSPDRDWHWSWLGGPAWLSDPEAVIEIGGSGFAPERMVWSRYLPVNGRNRAGSGVHEENGVIHLGTVPLRREFVGFPGSTPD